MKKRKQALILVAIFLFVSSIAILVGLITDFYLDWSSENNNKQIEYESYRLYFTNSNHYTSNKTPNFGKVEQISLSLYNKKEIVDYLKCCAIFPEELSSGEAKMLFFYDPLFEGDIYIRGEAYLEWSVDKETFDSEKERISNIEGEQAKHPLWSNNLFSLPGFVTIYNFDSEFEYALFEETTYTIRYIRFADMDSVENLNIQERYAPNLVMKLSDLYDKCTPWGGYNIYSIY